MWNPKWALLIGRQPFAPSVGSLQLLTWLLTRLTSLPQHPLLLAYRWGRLSWAIEIPLITSTVIHWLELNHVATLPIKEAGKYSLVVLQEEEEWVWEEPASLFHGTCQSNFLLQAGQLQFYLFYMLHSV